MSSTVASSASSDGSSAPQHQPSSADAQLPSTSVVAATAVESTAATVTAANPNPTSTPAKASQSNPSSSATPAVTNATTRTQAKKPQPASVRLQRLKSHSDHLSENCTKVVHASLTRAEHNIGLTVNLVNQTMQTVQENAIQLKTASSNFSECRPYLDSLSANRVFPPLKSA